MTHISDSHLFPTGYSYYFVVVEICIGGEILLVGPTLFASFNDISFLVLLYLIKLLTHSDAIS